MDVAAAMTKTSGIKPNFSEIRDGVNQRRRLLISPQIVEKSLLPGLVLHVVLVLTLELVFEVIKDALRVAGR